MRSEKSATRTQKETGVQNRTKLHYITDSPLNADIHWGIMLGCSAGEGSRKCRDEVHKSGLNYKWKYFLKGSSKRGKKRKSLLKWIKNDEEHSSCTRAGHFSGSLRFTTVKPFKNRHFQFSTYTDIHSVSARQAHWQFLAAAFKPRSFLLPKMCFCPSESTCCTINRKFNLPWTCICHPHRQRPQITHLASFLNTLKTNIYILIHINT